MKSLTLLLTVLLVGGVLVTPTYSDAASVTADTLPGMRHVQETSAALTALGCQAGQYPADQALIEVPAGKPYRVLAADQPAATVYFCDPTSAATLTVRQPAVAGVAQAATLGGVASTFLDSAWQFGSTQLGNFIPGLSAVNNVGMAVTGSKPSDLLEAGGLGSIGALAEGLAEVGLWLLEFAAKLLVFSLTTSSFLTNPLVRAAWPFVQGLANIGFMLALVFIALATTLQLEVGGGVRRLLPRLFIAALLLNFSLVIAGVLIDFTRVLMAIFLNVLTPANVTMDTLPGALYANTGIVQAFGNIAGIAPAKYDYAVSQIAKMILVWALAFSFLALAVGLIIRYIMLTLLLILSPLAYLAFAFPGAKELGDKWWREFFKYLFYGPLALFFIVLALRLNELGLESVSGGTPGIQNTINVALMVVLMVAAATASKSMGGSMSVAVLNFAQGKATSLGKRVGRTAVGGAAFATKQVAEKAELGRRGRNILDQVAQGTGMRILSPYYREEAKKQREKREKRQRSKSFGEGEAQLRYASPDKRAKLQAEAGWVSEVKSAPADPLNPALAAGRLRNNSVAKEVNARQLRALADGLVPGGMTTDEQLEVIVNSPDLIANMDVDTPQIIMTRLRDRMADPAASVEDKKEFRRLLEGLNRSVREAERRAQAA